MCDDPCFQCIPLRTLSDEAAVEILDFLQVFMTDFEIRYGNQIRRHYDNHMRRPYDERPPHNSLQRSAVAVTDDPPF